MPETIPHWLTKQAFLSPNKQAIELENGETITFSKLKEESQQFARKLAAMGIAAGDHVGILSTNNPTMIIAIHALSYLGAVGVLLNTRLAVNELQYQLDDADVKMFLYSDYLHAIAMELNSKKMSFSEIQAVEAKQISLVEELNLDQPFTIIYTSGTTGFPKGVVHTYGNHWWSALGSALNLGLTQHDKWLAVLPFFHVGGLSIFIKSVIYGMSVLLLEKFNEQTVHRAIMEKGVTHASVVTIMLQRLLDELKNDCYPNTFRCMLLGGGPVPKPLLQKAKTLHVPVFQSYGMTETSSQIVTLSPADALRKVGSAGKPLVPAQLKIEAKQQGDIGEILVKGPMVTKGYYNNEKATQSSFKNGWLQTGDLGSLDEEGFLYVADRRNDLIISGGENVYPSEVESVLAGMEQIKEIGVVGLDDPTWGQIPIAFVVQRTGAKLQKEDVVSYAAGKLAKYKIPKHVYLVDHLPRNASNKLLRTTLKKWAKEQREGNK